VALLLITPVCFASEFPSISDYLKSSNFKDPNVQLHVFDRCSGLTLALHFNSHNGHKLPEQFAPLMKNGYVNATKATIEVIKKNYPDPESISIQDMKNVDGITKQYMRHIAHLNSAGTKYDNDSLIASDVGNCEVILNRFFKQAKI
jgi:hypothetical protein